MTTALPACYRCGKPSTHYVSWNGMPDPVPACDEHGAQFVRAGEALYGPDPFERDVENRIAELNRQLARLDRRDPFYAMHRAAGDGMISGYEQALKRHREERGG